MDHIISKAYNGTDSDNNLVCSCKRCNSIKGDRLESEFLMIAYDHLMTVGDSPPLEWVLDLLQAVKKIESLVHQSYKLKNKTQGWDDE